ncbi:MAG TPA: hypothetical protein DER01_07585, partial [Phycisphaerales bacterium]|nr:hypothetical protein [Phycisphaerales bacterium]
KHVAHIHQQQAFEQTAVEFGLPTGDQWIVRADIDYPKTARPLAEGCRITTELLKRPTDTRPTAIIYGNDAMAVGGLQAAGQMNVSVPGELSIIGTSDSFMASGSEPQLTSIREDHHQLMATALRLVDLQIRNMSIPQRHVLVDGPLVKRESCAPPMVSK